MASHVRRFAPAAGVLVVWMTAAPSLYAQGLTGQISGSVVDSSGSVLPGATVSVRNVGTQAARSVSTDETGAFVVTELLAGTYDVTVELEGFKTHTLSDVALSANERVALRRIVLDVGEVTETVSVSADVARVQTQSAERSGLITQAQLEDIALKGRDYMGTLRLLPGVVDTHGREAPGWNNLTNLSINGGRTNTINLTYDGVTNLDTGSNTGPFLAPGLDSIAEVKVLTSNYQAEYGRSSGGTINVVTKSGSRDFRGGGFYAKRHERLNANEWQNNKFGEPKPPYRYDYVGYHLGGPVLLPNFNQERNKLFFFWSQEFLPRTNPGTLQRRTMPTELERQGNFSRSLDTNGNLLIINDPLTGQPFPGNVIPPGRIDANGQALLNLLPLPNATDPARQFNYTFQSSFDQPRNDQVLRVDWNVAPRTTFYSRLNFGYEAFKGGWGFVLNNANWPQLPIAYEIHSYGVVNTLLHTFDPTTVLEVTVGLNHGKQTVEPLTQADLDRNDRTQVGLAGLPQFFPESNPQRIVPNANFGASGLALENLPQLGVEGRYPFFGENDIWNASANLTKVMGPHNVKAGIFYEYTTRPAARSTQFNGTFTFSRDTNNPLDANHPFANALIGSVGSYSEATGHPDADAQFMNVEWFIQDNWRVGRNVTIDGGVRFYYIGPTRSRGDQLAVFQPDAFEPGNAPQLVQPIITPDGRRGINPVTGEILPAATIGAFASGSGDPTNGVQIFDESVLDAPPIQVAPRIGFSWDVRGDGRTAVRGGFGVFPDRFNDDVILQLVELPPLVNTPSVNYTTIEELLSAPLSLSPGTARHLDSDYEPQMKYNWSIGLQRDLGYQLVADVAYVGSAGRQLLQVRNLNAVPYGTRFQASSIDPTTGDALPSNFLRPFRGYGDILFHEFAGFSDYHALQVQLNRRYMDGLQFGVSYTLSSSKTTSGTVNPFLDVRDRSYAGEGRKHNLAINYVYEIPSLAKRWNHALAHAIFDGWELSGVTTALSGAALGLSYEIEDVTDLTGGAGNGVDTRVDLTGDPNLPRGERTPDRAFRTEVVRPPSLETNRIGTAKNDDLIGPGYLNWDIAINRNIPFGGNRRLQFRVELYNAFNNVQFSSVDTGALFDQAGNQIDAEFGRYTAARDARRIQLTLRAQF
ncbi:MAG: TonB-dependent receptor plug domain-containing protein [Luteitalea sp.]|nr:TonB-dependent receptor plug domain-containing protein [Luteitalea sp.]